MKKLLFSLPLLLLSLTSSAITLPRLFQSGMVLQRQQPLPVWGTANGGETVTVTVTISGKATGAVTLTLTDASWLAPSVPAGVTHTSGTVLTVANGTNLGDGVTVKCEFTVSSTVTTTNIELA